MPPPRLSPQFLQQLGLQHVSRTKFGIAVDQPVQKGEGLFIRPSFQAFARQAEESVGIAWIQL